MSDALRLDFDESSGMRPIVPRSHHRTIAFLLAACAAQPSTTTAVFEDRPASGGNGHETDDQIARSLSDLVDGRSEASRRPSRREETRIATVLLPVSPSSVDGKQL